MFSTGNYERMYYDILKRYDGYDSKTRITFGILIADPRQTESKEYILNYLSLFNKRSGKFFDFFIPGYFEEPYFGGIEIKVDNKSFYFNESYFLNFCENLKKDFDIEYTFNPMLILTSMYKEYPETAEYIIIELDDYGPHGVKRSGNLFLDIFEAAKGNCSLEGLRDSFIKTYVHGNALQTIISAIGQDWLTEITKTSKELKRFKIKNRE